MIFGKTKLELKVGVFVFIGLAILAFFVLSIGGIKTWNSGYHVTFTFNFVNGVKIGAPVRFSGVDVGDVKKIYFKSLLDGKLQVEVDAWVKNDIKIPMDSTIWVNTLGLLGEKYVEIIPGKDLQNFILPGGVLAGQDPMPMNEVFELTKKIADNLNTTITNINNKQGTLGKFLNDSSIYDEMELMIKDIRNNPWKLFWKTKEKPIK